MEPKEIQTNNLLIYYRIHRDNYSFVYWLDHTELESLSVFIKNMLNSNFSTGIACPSKAEYNPYIYACYNHDGVFMRFHFYGLIMQDYEFAMFNEVVEKSTYISQ